MTPAPEPTLEAVGLTCVRHDRTLFSGLDFQVRPGEIVQVEGANGSGKTSLLRMLCGMLPPEDGAVRWCGRDIQEQRAAFLAEVAYVGHAPGVKDDLTPRENLRLDRALGRPRGDGDLEAALSEVGLYGYEDLPVRTLSAGQRRRVAMARLLVTDNRLWVLDEPFTALDRTGRDFIEALLVRHSESGGMAVLTTHHPVNLGERPTTEVRLTP